MNDLARTPLTAWHEAHGGKMVDFAGYAMPVGYAEGVLAEHRRVRRAVGLFDISHMAELHVRGSKARAAVDGLVTNNVGRMGTGQVLYTALCREDGGILDDLLIYCLGEEHFLIVANASNRAKVAAWFGEHLPDDVSLEDASDATALIAVQGPSSTELLRRWERARGVDLESLDYYRAVEKDLGGVACVLSRTGYTGERGYEIYLPPEAAVEAWEELLGAGKGLDVGPVGLGARDTLRLEACYSLYGHELDEAHSPFESNIGWVVRLKKPADFVGRAALARQKEEGVDRTVVGFTLPGRHIARDGALLFADEEEAGRVTSGTFSPTLERGIALARIRRDMATADLEVEIRGRRLAVERVETPFVASRVKDAPGH
jgi:aminomethyltransferase